MGVAGEVQDLAILGIQRVQLSGLVCIPLGADVNGVLDMMMLEGDDGLSAVVCGGFRQILLQPFQIAGVIPLAIGGNTDEVVAVHHHVLVQLGIHVLGVAINTPFQVVQVAVELMVAHNGDELSLVLFVGVHNALPSIVLVGLTVVGDVTHCYEGIHLVIFLGLRVGVGGFEQLCQTLGRSIVYRGNVVVGGHHKAERRLKFPQLLGAGAFLRRGTRLGDSTFLHRRVGYVAPAAGGKATGCGQ